MLAAKGNTNDGEIQQNAEDNMRDGSPQPTAQQPDNVEYSSEATRVAAIAYHLRAEWYQYYQTNLKTLQAERNTYNGET